MKFLADMGISMTTVKWLHEKGYDALHVRDLGMQKSPDYEIMEKAKQDDRIILTCDLDFGDLLAASGDIIPSVITFRLENEKPDNINSRLKTVLNEASETLEKGSIISVEESKYRVRKLPIK